MDHEGKQLFGFHQPQEFVDQVDEVVFGIRRRWCVVSEPGTAQRPQVIFQRASFLQTRRRLQATVLLESTGFAVQCQQACQERAVFFIVWLKQRQADCFAD